MGESIKHGYVRLRFKPICDWITDKKVDRISVCHELLGHEFSILRRFLYRVVSKTVQAPLELTYPYYIIARSALYAPLPNNVPGAAPVPPSLAFIITFWERDLGGGVTALLPVGSLKEIFWIRKNSH